ncbi:MAG TPA: methionine--tRNA ligase [Candidatus Aminicenantes bacterium]|nr:methionine--tRNA ligase [Candidatus Aminicenantes bacterium]
MEKFYLTTPIYYVNDVPHIGHAYTTILADVIKRYKQLRGLRVMFLTGTDEHGQKIERSAAKQGLTPQELADRMVAHFQRLWTTLNIGYDAFIRTTDEVHVRGVQKIFSRVREQGDIYLGEYAGHYCISCENFIPDSVEETADGRRACPDCGRLTDNRVSETCYFFRLSAYGDKLLKFYEENPEFVTPRSRMNEVVSFVKMGLRDLSVTRSTVKWGIPVPGDPGQTIYVWFDALANYVTAIDYLNEGERFRALWPADLHIMAKDILKYHAVYWPAFLMAAGLPLPKKELIHGWWLKDEKKMSKSSGNVLDPHILLRHFSPDAIRYFMMREASIGADGNFSHEGFIHRVNTDLTNDWANLVSRTTGMIEKYFANEFRGAGLYTEREKGIAAGYRDMEKAVLALFDQYQFNRGLELIFDYVNGLNRYIVEVQPWNLAKEEADRPRLAGALKTLCRAILSVNGLLSPILTETAAAVRDIFRCGDAGLGWRELPEEFAIGRGTQLFPRVDSKAFFSEADPVPAAAGKGTIMQETKTPETVLPPQAPTIPPSAEGEGLIEIDDFKKVRMVVARVLAAEKVEKADKLLQLQVDTGDGTRTLVAGIALHYRPEDLVGRKIIIVKNLKPAKLRGILSQGMILAASDADNRPYVPILPEETPIGAILK